MYQENVLFHKLYIYGYIFYQMLKTKGVGWSKGFEQYSKTTELVQRGIPLTGDAFVAQFLTG